MAAEASRSGSGSVDSYIGSLISLTSKCEIRYEGVLFNINTEESSIGLRNVRSFGTEGRKKDGPHIPPSDKVYDYILFRGSDIKDLQVKSSPPAQTMPPIHNDPAIIQSHYSQPASASTSPPSVGNGAVADLSSHTAQLGPPRSTFQAGLPLYQPRGNLGSGGNLGSWASSPAPPSANASGLPMPMYWQGFYGPSSRLPHLQQEPLLQPGGPPPGLPIPHSMQQPMQYPSTNPSFPTGAPNRPEFPSPLLPPVSGTLNLASTTLPSTLPPVQTAALASETSPSLMVNKVPVTSLPVTTLSTNLPFIPSLTSSLDINAIIAPISSKPRTVPGPSLPYPIISHSLPDVGGPSTLSHNEASVPSLVTPGQLLQQGPTNLSSSRPLQKAKDVEVIQPALSESSAPAPTDAMAAPILPLPTLPDQKVNVATSHSHHNHTARGHERGRGYGISRSVTKFTEEFDFIAMNEKFKKDEVWGHLGKSKAPSGEKEGGANYDNDYIEDDNARSSKVEIKPVYVKDDFFDSLSCNALDRGLRNGRTKFSEQLKIDTETFGDFPRHRGRSGRGSSRGGRSHGVNYGRGYGYVGRGWGQVDFNRSN